MISQSSREKDVRGSLDSFLLAANRLLEKNEKVLKKVDETFLKKSISYLTMRSRRLQESMSSDDWIKFGVALGILWQRLDRLIEEVRTASGHLKDINRGVERLK